MRHVLRIVVGVLLIITPLNGQSGTVRTPTQIAESFLARIIKGEVGPAYDELFAGSPIVGQPMQVDVLKRQTEAMIPVFGKALGFELYRADKYGESLVRLQYIERLEKHPVVWRFWMYKPGATWQVNQITFNDQLTFD